MSTPERPIPPAPDDSPARQGPPTWAWGVAVGLFLLLGAPTLIRYRDEGPGYALGAFTGGLLAALAVALILRFAYVKLAAKDRPLWSPWLFAIAAGVLLVLALGRAGEAAQREAASPDSARELFADLPASLSYRTSPASERRPIEASFREELGSPDDFEVRRISRRDGAQGLVIAIVANGAGDLEDFERGFESAGGTGAPETIAGTEFLVGRDRAGRFGAYRGSGDDGLVLILGLTEADVRSFARPFAEG